jgi:acyl dehydratase
MIAGALFSRLVGMYLPGTYSLYLSQTLAFRKPIRVGVTVGVTGTVVRKTAALNVLILHTELRDKKTGDVLTDGEATVRVLV